MEIWAINENWETIITFKSINEALTYNKSFYQILYRENKNYPVRVLK